MSIRKSIPLALLLGALGALLFLYPAHSQTTTTETTTTTTTPTAIETSLIFDFTVIPSRGIAAINVLGGSEDGLLGVACTGNNPQNGSVVPAIVLSKLDAHQITLRIASWGTGNPAVNGTPVDVNCAIDAFWEQPTLAQRARTARLHQQ